MSGVHVDSSINAKFSFRLSPIFRLRRSSNWQPASRLAWTDFRTSPSPQTTSRWQRTSSSCPRTTSRTKKS